MGELKDNQGRACSKETVEAPPAVEYAQTTKTTQEPEPEAPAYRQPLVGVSGAPQRTVMIPPALGNLQNSPAARLGLLAGNAAVGALVGFAAARTPKGALVGSLALTAIAGLYHAMFSPQYEQTWRIVYGVTGAAAGATAGYLSYKR